MKITFVLPDENYYEKPSKKGSLIYLLDFETKKITIQKSHLDEEKRVGTLQEYPLLERENTTILSAIGNIEKWQEIIKTYTRKDGLCNSHTLIKINEFSCYIPDYLANFGELDIFDRYRFYPEKERVDFYKGVRIILKLLFERFGYPKEKPISLKPYYALRNNEEAYRLEIEPLTK